MTPIAGLFVSEWLKGRGRPLDRFTLAIAVSLGTLVPVLMVVTTRNNPVMHGEALKALAFPSSLTASATFLAVIGPMCAAAVGANVVGAEYQYGTWPWLLVRCPRRWRLFVAKVVVAACRTAGVALLGVFTFCMLGAIIGTLMGPPGVADALSIRALAATLVMVIGTMTFAAAIALLVTVFARAVTIGVLVGATATPLMMVLRFKETASWNYYLHLQNVQAYVAGQPAALLRLYEFDSTALTSTMTLAGELLTLLITAYLVFRRQEIVY
jgi:ABC-type transport system involved in multi-copper enzyme maturation permease subunit